MSHTRKTWGASHKTIEEPIGELGSFDDQQLTVMVSDDGGETLRPVKLVGKEFIDDQPYCTLFIES